MSTFANYLVRKNGKIPRGLKGHRPGNLGNIIISKIKLAKKLLLSFGVKIAMFISAMSTPLCREIATGKVR